MLKPEPSHRFKKDLKKYQHNKAIKEAFDVVLKILTHLTQNSVTYLRNYILSPRTRIGIK
jgi:hypothetical protein